MLLPILIKILSVVGTWAMLVVAGNLFIHNILFIHDLYKEVNYIPSLIFETILGFFVGIVFMFVYLLLKKLFKKV